MRVIKNRLRLCRVEKGFTQEKLAEKIGITRQTIGLIEKGYYNPTISLCLSLCYVLDKTLDEIFWMEGNENAKR